MRIDVVSVFPDYLSPLELALVGKARQRGLLDVRVHDLRDWTTDVHRTVDDAPFGGGGGMVMKPEPWFAALESLRWDGPAPPNKAQNDAASPPPRPRVVVPTPSGRPLTQRWAAQLAAEPWLAIACGRYEGIDQRVLDELADDLVSLGDYVIAGGEAAALVIVEAVTRLLPGVVGNAESVVDDSFSRDGGLLEGPVYTRPAIFRGHAVPEVLLSGDHAAIAHWRRDQAQTRTQSRRPDLLEEAAEPRLPGVAGPDQPAS